MENINSDNNKILFLNLPLFDEVLDFHARTTKTYNISKVLACGLTGYSCEYNPSGSKTICRLCQSRAKRFAEDFDKPISFIEPSIIKNIQSLDLNKCRNFALSLYRSHEFLKKKKIRSYIDRLGCYSMEISNWLETSNFCGGKDTYYFFNSRFPGASAAARFCLSKKLDFITYDKIAQRRIVYTKNRAVLDPEALRDGLNYELRNASKKLIQKFAAEFIDKKLNNKFVAYDVFTKRQKLGLLPENIGPEFYTVYTSSEDEMEYFGEDLGFPLVDQLSEIVKLCEFHVSKQLVARVHPNQSGSELERKLKKLSTTLANLCVIEGKSSFSTYSLLMASDINISFGSSTAIESILLGKRAVLLGRAIYDKSVLIETYDNADDFNRAPKCAHSIEDKQVKQQAENWVNFISGNLCPGIYRLDERIYVSDTSRLLIIYWRIRRLLFHPLRYYFKFGL